MKKLIAMLITATLVLSSVGAFAAPGNRPTKPGSSQQTTDNVMFYVSRWGVQWDSQGNVKTQDISKFSDMVGSSTLKTKLNKNFNIVIGNGVTSEDVISYVKEIPDENDVFTALKNEYKRSRAELYTSSGKKLTWEDLIGADYDLQWYVLKNENDGWHVDGLIVETETQDKVDIVLPDEQKDYDKVQQETPPAPSTPEDNKTPENDDVTDEPSDEDVTDNGDNNNSEPTETDTSITISGAKYAYIFGYEPVITTTIDENGQETYTAEIMMGMDDDVTVEQVSSMLMRILDQNGDTSGMNFPMTDNVRPHQGQWYERGLLYLCSVGGFDEDEAIHTAPISRGQVAKLVACALKLNLSKETPFDDIAESEYKEYIEKVYAYGYMNGLGDGSFAPEKTMTRAEFCSLFNNILDRDSLGLTALSPEGIIYRISADDYYFIDMDPSHWAYEICLKATSAYDEKGFVDTVTRNANIRNIIDRYDSQKIY